MLNTAKLTVKSCIDRYSLLQVTTLQPIVKFHFTNQHPKTMDHAIVRCNTLLFFDIETTGLPEDAPTRITEMSFCAIERSQFLSAKPRMSPRVTNRLNLCVYPNREIHYEASKITGMYTKNLLHQSPFDENTAEIVLRFLKRLSGPVCIIAHNGIKFDFPVLKSEFESIGKSLPEDLLYADSLLLFQQHLTFPDTRPKYFNLEAIYKKLYKKKIQNAHCAEADVLALLQCAITFNSKFVDKVDACALPFRNIVKLW